ncbi:MAG TPA: hypothetical protein VNE38_06205 [Ktedonobacteraceae bacterium]|nr:hypothetical protein [Ktedonobacteraceae bacterium]
MSRRIAYRPRYQRMRRLPHLSFHSHKDFLHYGWTYRPQAIHFPKLTPGQSLLSVPWGYQL